MKIGVHGITFDPVFPSEGVVDGRRGNRYNHAGMAKILIAEDDESTRELLKYIVMSAGFEVTTAADGQIALNMITNAPPDLVVLDIMLPEVHGFSICHQVKSNEALKKIKVLMLSAKAFPADRRQAENVGADGFMSKPVNPEELIQKIKSLLSA